MALVKRSDRVRKPVVAYTPSKSESTVQDHTVTNYALNVEKALHKKLEATERKNIDVDYKRGNLVISLSAAAFEAFRLCAKTLADARGLGLCHKITPQQSKNGLVVAESVSIREKGKKKQLYRINLYLTTCIVNVNGGSLSVFINSHLPKILDKMQKMGDYKTINAQMKTACNKLLEKINQKEGALQIESETKIVQQQNDNQSHTSSKREIPQLTYVNNTQLIQPTVNNTDMSDSGSSSGAEDVNSDTTIETLCAVCEESCPNSCVYCDVCHSWMHYACEALTKERIEELEGSAQDYLYTCRQCLLSTAIEYNARTDETSDREDNIVEISDGMPQVVLSPTKEEKDQENNQQKNSGPQGVHISNENSVVVHSQKVMPSNSPLRTNHSEENKSTRLEKGTSTYGLSLTNSVDKSTSTCGLQDSTWLEKEAQLTRKIKDLEKDLKLKEQKLADANKQLATSRAYIVTLEHRIEEKLRSDEMQTNAAKEKGPNRPYNLTSNEVINTRMQAMECRMQAVENHLQNIRMTTLEEKLSKTETKVIEMENHMPKSNNTAANETNTQSFLSQGHQTEKPPWNESQEKLKRPQKPRQRSKKKSPKSSNPVQTSQERVTQSVPLYSGEHHKRYKEYGLKWYHQHQHNCTSNRWRHQP